MWAAWDADTRQVVATVVGDRSEGTARRLSDTLPPADRAVVPEERRAAAGLTNHIKRFWFPLRQRCGRFVRNTLSFSKCVRNHLGAMWSFIRHVRCRP